MPLSSLPRSRWAVAALVAMLAFAGVAPACSDDDGRSDSDAGSSTTADDEATTTTSQTATSTAARGEEPPPPEQFSGTDEAFYLPPDPLPEGEPGALIRTQALGEAEGRVTVKIMYHSRDARDRDRAVTGLVTYPTAEAPEDGWPVVATAPGTTGVSARCGVSHQASEAPSWGIDGVSVITDYIGLGPVGDPLHAYLSRPSEGHSVIDAVRAARQLPDAEAGDQWLSVGHSQGGHGALSAHELSQDYAPELELVGTLALAPAAMFDRVYGGIDPIVTGILTAMSLYGGAGEHPEIDVDDYVTPELAEVADVLETGCLAEIIDALVPLAVSGGLFSADPRQTEPARSLVLANDVGKVAVDAPLYLVSGTADDRVVIDRVRDLYARLCATGQVTELLIVEGATHDSIIPQTTEQTSAWLQARLDGEEPIDSCAESPTAPTPPGSTP